jgi:hypothetical protein
MRIRDFMRQFAVPVPHWLAGFELGDRPSLREVLSSRTVYYPGGLSDGHPFELFGASHAAHVFVYADYGLSREELSRHLSPDSHQRLLGYDVVDIVDLSESDIAPAGWHPHLTDAEHRDRVQRGESWVRDWMKGQGVTPYGALVVFQRRPRFDNHHGPARLSLLQLGADGIATYDVLFCQHGQRAPWALVLQDHGFGGNWDSFGRNGLMHAIAQRAGRMPEWVLLGHPTEVWDGFEPVRRCRSSIGGMHHGERHLFRFVGSDPPSPDLDKPVEST